MRKLSNAVTTPRSHTTTKAGRAGAVAKTSKVKAAPAKRRVSTGQPKPVLDPRSSAGVRETVAHAASRGSLFEQSHLPHLSPARTNLAKFSSHLAAQYGKPGGSDALATELLHSSMGQALADVALVPQKYRSAVEDGVQMYLAPALLAFAKAFDASGGAPFAKVDEKVTVVTPPTVRTWGASEELRRDAEVALGIGPIREEQKAAGEALIKGLRLPDGDPRRAAAIATYNASSARTTAAVTPILQKAKEAGYGQLAAEAISPRSAYERDQIGVVAPGSSRTALATDYFKKNYNDLLALRQRDPKAFDSVVRTLTVDPTPFLGVLLSQNAYSTSSGGRLNDILRQAERLLPSRPEQAILAGFGRLYGSMLSDPSKAALLSSAQHGDNRAADLEWRLGQFIGARVGVGEKELEFLFASGRQLDFQAGKVRDTRLKS